VLYQEEVWLLSAHETAKHNSNATMADMSDTDTDAADNRSTMTSVTTQEDELEQMLLQAELLAVKMRSSLSSIAEEALSPSRTNSHRVLAMTSSYDTAGSSKAARSYSSPAYLLSPQLQQSPPYLSSSSPQLSMEDGTLPEPPPFNTSVLSGTYSVAGTKTSLMTASSRDDESTSSHQSSHRSLDIEAAVKASRDMELALQALGASRHDDSDEEDLTQEELLRRDDDLFHHSGSNMAGHSPQNSASTHHSPTTISSYPTSPMQKSAENSHNNGKEHATPLRQTKQRRGDVAHEVHWDTVPTPRSQDEDYVPLSDYSQLEPVEDYAVVVDYSKTTPPKEGSSKNGSLGDSSTGKKETSAMISPSLSNSSPIISSARNTHTHGVKWEKMNFVESHDDDYTPLADYSKNPTHGSSYSSYARGFLGNRIHELDSDDGMSTPERSSRRRISTRNIRRKRMMRWIARMMAALVFGTLLYGILYPRSVPDLRSANSSISLVDHHHDHHHYYKSKSHAPSSMRVEEEATCDRDMESSTTTTKDETSDPTHTEESSSSDGNKHEASDSMESYWLDVTPWTRDCYVPFAWLIAEHCHTSPRYERLESILASMFE
jgi:hypothetical protein